VDELTQLLRDLVSIPSVNPMGRSLAGPDYFETRLASFLEAWFHELGVRFERQPVAPGRDNLLAWYDAPDPRTLILFDVHQDTVPADGMSIPPFVPELTGGRLSGRGSCDVKGAMAAMLWAFARLVRERPAGSASVLMACTVDEEFTHLGADVAIVAEPTLLDLVHCHKGVLRFKIRTKGVACHSSTPNLGENAIYRMGEVLGFLQKYAGVLAGSAPDPILGPPTLSVGRIEGGQSVNVVPDWCEIEVDRRLIPGEDAATALDIVKQLVNKIFDESDCLDVSQPSVHMPPLVSQASRWIEPLTAAIERATAHRPQVIGVPFGTDAGPLSEKGTPCVVFGPGDIAQAHTKDEWIDLDQVHLAAEAYFQIAVELGR
jgi:acetylornithine deacetylase/succinyl-diaminopimelate desuccinylase-like protein